MMFRRKRFILLSSVALLFALMIADIWVGREAMFEAFGEQFVNERRTEAMSEAFGRSLANGQGAGEPARRGATAAVERELAIDMRGMAGVEIAGAGGAIAVERSAGAAVRLEYTVTAAANDAAEAQRKAEDVEVEQTAGGGYVTLSAKANGRPIGNDAISVDYVLQVPDGVNVRIEEGAGDIRIRGIAGDVDAEFVGGYLEIADVRGRVAVDALHASVYLTGIAGNVDAVSRYGVTTIERTEGQVAFDSQFGDSYMYRIRGRVTGTANYGSVRLSEIEGSVQMDNRGADLQLERIRGDMDIASELGRTVLVLADAEEGYDLQVGVSQGDIHSHLPHPVPIERNANGPREARMNGVVGNGVWAAKIEAARSDVVIHHQ